MQVVTRLAAAEERCKRLAASAEGGGRLGVRLGELAKVAENPVTAKAYMRNAALISSLEAAAAVQ